MRFETRVFPNLKASNVLYQLKSKNFYFNVFIIKAIDAL
jgi:hypothetical protein